MPEDHATSGSERAGLNGLNNNNVLKRIYNIVISHSDHNMDKAAVLVR